MGKVLQAVLGIEMLNVPAVNKLQQVTENAVELNQIGLLTVLQKAYLLVVTTKLCTILPLTSVVSQEQLQSSEPPVKSRLQLVNCLLHVFNTLYCFLNVKC